MLTVRKGMDLVKVGFLGFGRMGITHYSILNTHPRVHIVGVCDQSTTMLNIMKKYLNVATYSDYRKMLDDVELDCVVISTPGDSHFALIQEAIGRNLHVFVEKPIANTLADGKKMIEACQKSGVVLMVGHYMRRRAGNRKAKELIDGGAIGKPIMVEANISSGRGWGLTPDQFRWRGDDTGCPGGVLMTMGIHYVDTLNYLFGPIKTVSAYLNKLYIPADVEDVTTTIFQFESGILGYIGANYASPRTIWMHIYGTEANLLWTVSQPEFAFDEYHKTASDADQYTRMLLFEKGKEGRDIPLTPRDPILEEIDEFAHCVRTGAKPETDGQSSLAALALIRAAIESARTGKQAKLEI